MSVETATASPPKKTKSPKKANIVDRLTDPKLYTGAHKNRFDENGKGRGIEGRSDRVELDGYVDGFKKSMNKSTSKGSNSGSSSSGSIFDKLTDPKQYTGMYKNRFDESGKGLGVNTTIDKNQITDLSQITRAELRGSPSSSGNLKPPGSPMPKSSSTGSNSGIQKSPSSNSPKKSGSSIFEKLTDPKLYTGAHKNRFDENGKGRGIDGRSDRIEADGYVNGYQEKGSFGK